MNIVVVKRDGRQEPFDEKKVRRAIARSMAESPSLLSIVGQANTPDEIAKSVARVVKNKVGSPVTVEQVQDMVETQLMAHGEFNAAKAYILYREEHRKQRESTPLSAGEAQEIRDGMNWFQTPLQKVQFVDKYARWNAERGRRETWPETVTRVITFFQRNVAGTLPQKTWDELTAGMLNLEALPSMRVVQMAGPALERCHVGAYNCSYAAIDSIQAFPELLYILMQGTGAGFSVESAEVDKLPRVKRQKRADAALHIVQDSTIGWCEALRLGLEAWFDGRDVTYDFSLVRPQGAILKTKGGRASGPEPLRQLLAFARDKILSRQGARLSTVDAHDIACFCGQIVQVGGVRRAAEISLSDLDDEAMRSAKSGQFWLNQPQRAMANNSAVYDEKPTAVEFIEEWLELAKSGTGERGIFNRDGIQGQIPSRRKKAKFGVNPCGEIVLRPKQFCNLSIAVARHNDTDEDLVRKVALAATFGTLQSSLTSFKYLSPEWAKNCAEERLLGVDITGQLDCPLLRPSKDPVERQELLEDLLKTAVETNRLVSAQLGIEASTAVTCVKPSGNSATLLGCSSGLHPRYAEYYIRRVRIGAHSPVAKLLKDSGIPWHTEVGQTLESATVLVFEFPIKSPEGAPTRHDMTALDQLENWLDWKRFYTEHNPSITVYVDQDEWLTAGNWVYENWHYVGGISFLPKDGGIYQLAPYEEITKEAYEKRAASLPTIDFAKLARYEREDMTEVAQDYACVGGVCEIA